MVIAYLSVGTDRNHLDIQRDIITKFVATKDNLQVDKWITDVTGEKAKQMGQNLKDTLDRVNEGDILIVSDITRLSRSVFEMMEILSLCLTKKVSLWCIEDRYIFDSSMDSKKMVEAFKLTESIDHALISMRTKDSLIELKHAGKKLGRPKGSESKQLFLDASKEEIISMFERGETVTSICKYYNVSKNTFYKFKKNYGL
ncbi:recombinase family protein [Parabacteroides chinchillae]|uniref:Site-specific DNA recombinase n=1 Tax=Parabacteroides chinchillae TaxID=871327 RepID=A0A8G2BTT6_9BACT|nr:recombinase family protein [Parabacteroides chinchillae]SEF44570.1 Site-specific DNA recombinase [Parabacteroides chinchillae]